MAPVINLNRARKVKRSADAAAKAVENRIAFGRSKAAKAEDAAARDKVARGLDQARREP